MIVSMSTRHRPLAHIIGKVETLGKVVGVESRIRRGRIFVVRVCSQCSLRGECIIIG